MKKEIWTYLETDGRGELLSTSKELLAKAGIIAAAAEEEKNYTVCALLAGGDHDALESAAEKALGAGAGKALLIEGAELSVYSAEFYSDAIGRLAETEKPEMILFERTTDGMDLAPRLAARLKAGMISDCVDLVKKDGKLLWIRHAFGGTAAAAVSFREEESPHIISIRPGSFGGAGRRVNNLVDTRFFTPDVFAAGRLQTSRDRIGETRSGISPRAAAPGSGMFGRMNRCCQEAAPAVRKRDCPGAAPGSAVIFLNRRGKILWKTERSNAPQ